MDVTVVVGTFGEPSWGELAWCRAIPSAAVLDVAYEHVHGPSLHEARNEGAGRSSTEWLCFLDADDELEGRYFHHMAKATTDLRAPLVRYVAKRAVDAYQPVIPEGPADIADGNRYVIGTLVRRDLFLSVGGFRAWPMYEDWCLWQRCILAGATVSFTEAVYRAHMRPGSRNRAPAQFEKERVHHDIRRANMPWLYEQVPA